MTVKELVEFLSKQDQDAEVKVWDNEWDEDFSLKPDMFEVDKDGNVILF